MNAKFHLYCFSENEDIYIMDEEGAIDSVGDGHS